MHNLVPIVKMAIAVQGTAFGALAGAWRLTPRRTTKAPRAASPSRLPIYDVSSQVSNLFLAEPAGADFLVLLEVLAVPSTEAAAAVLAGSYGCGMAAPEECTKLASSRHDNDDRLLITV